MLSNGEKSKSRCSPWGAVVLSTAFVGYGLNGGLFAINGLIKPTLLQLFQTTEVTVAWLLSIQVGLGLSSGLIGGVLVELYGCRFTCILGTVIATTGYILSSFVTDIVTMFFTYSIIPGLGLGLQYVPTVVAVQYYFDEKRTAASGFQLSGSGFGVFLFNLLFQYLLETYGLSWSIRLSGAIFLHSIPLALAMTIHPKTQWIAANEIKETQTGPGDVETRKPKSTSLLSQLLLTLKGIGHGFGELKDPACAICFIAAFAAAVAYPVIFIYIPGKALSLGYTTLEAASLTSVVGFTDFSTRIVVGWLGICCSTQVLMLFVLGTIFGSVGHIGTGYVTSFTSLLVFSTIIGLGTGCFYALQPQTLVDILGYTKIARFIGLMSAANGIAVTVSPPIVALLYEYSGDFGVTFYVTGACQIGAAILLLAYRFSPLYRKRPGLLEKKAAAEDTEPVSHLIISQNISISVHSLRSTNNDVDSNRAVDDVES